MEVLASAPRMERRGQRGLMVSLGRLADFRFGIPPETSCFHRIQADKTKAVLGVLATSKGPSDSSL